MQENNVHIVVNPGRPDCAHASGQITAKAFRCSFCGYETKKWEQPMMANGFPAGHVEYHDFSGGAVGEPGEFMDHQLAPPGHHHRRIDPEVWAAHKKLVEEEPQHFMDVNPSPWSEIASKAPQCFTEAHGYESDTEMPNERIERLEGILDDLSIYCFETLEDHVENDFVRGRKYHAREVLYRMGYRGL